MGNRVIHINQSAKTPLKTSREPVFVDVSMISDPSNIAAPEKTDPKYQIYVLLAEEFPQLLEERGNILTEPEGFPERLQYYMKMRGGIDEEMFWKDFQEFLKKAKYRIATLEDVKAVFNSLKNIFSWTPGERVLLPEFGNKLRRLLYEGITPQNTEQIIAEIRHCVTEWEPRVVIQKIMNASTVEDTEDNTVHIEVEFTIPKLTEDYSYTYPITSKVTE